MGDEFLAALVDLEDVGGDESEVFGTDTPNQEASGTDTPDRVTRAESSTPTDTPDKVRQKRMHSVELEIADVESGEDVKCMFFQIGTGKD